MPLALANLFTNSLRPHNCCLVLRRLEFYWKLSHVRPAQDDIQGLARAGDRVLLVFLPGFDFVRAFTACLMSGCVAVPVYPVNPKSPKTGASFVLSFFCGVFPFERKITTYLLQASW